MPNAVASFFQRGWQATKEELQNTVDNIRRTKLNIAFLFAVFCVLFVIVGNVILLISINFWIAQFPTDALAHNSSQIAIQVVTMLMLVFVFSVLCAVFTVFYGALPLWHVLADRNRVGGPWHRLFLLFASGASNGISSVLAVYAMTHTPEFIQAVLLCCIPFSAQAWTVIFIPIERKRDYLSIFFIASFLLFVAGVLLSSMSAFLHPNENGEKASVPWALLYFASSVIFGLWCVVQRLYLDAVAVKVTPEVEDAGRRPQSRDGDHGPQQDELRDVAHAEEMGASVAPATDAVRQCTQKTRDASAVESSRFSDVEDDEELPLSPSAEILAKRQWGSQNVDDKAAKMVLLLVGMLFQLLVSFVVFPVDAIPWFGTSDSALHAWEGLRDSIDFIFASWLHVRHGLLLTLGFAMSFIGCTYLNEHSPTLASVVLQLAGPITSLTIIIVPQWNVYKDSSSVGNKVGGVILLLAAALLYHLWEQQSLRVLLAKAEEAKRRHERAAAGGDEAPEQCVIGANNCATAEPIADKRV
ncbi:hypothetical predicted multipass transmembrane protein [Leishmania tarentolae]|uniref:Hypothetical predicted multipass transmembrane protein n=1 Tax=Leishmania tarentolae TaxID=5689 RepID=A0A640KMP5_LEITA|nr:hypothetical predicted multipass transmembrane protein [Leishmania tarentolae]